MGGPGTQMGVGRACDTCGAWSGGTAESCASSCDHTRCFTLTSTAGPSPRSCLPPTLHHAHSRATSTMHTTGLSAPAAPGRAATGPPRQLTGGVTRSAAGGGARSCYSTATTFT